MLYLHTLNLYVTIVENEMNIVIKKWKKGEKIGLMVGFEKPVTFLVVISINSDYVVTLGGSANVI